MPRPQPDPRKPRRAGLGVGAALALLGVVGVLSWVRQEEPRQIAPAIPVAKPAGAESHGPAAIFQSPSAPTRAPAAKVTAGSMELCGVGRAPSEITAQNANAYVKELTRNTSSRWKAALRDSSDMRTRAVGLVIQTFESRLEGASVVSDESRDELVQFAVGAGDPFIYTMAVDICGTGSKAAAVDACQRITLDEWSRLDSNNATAWLAVAQQAREQGDPRAEATAFSQAAGAGKVDSYFSSVLQIGRSEVPAGATPLERAAIANDLIGYAVAYIRPFREVFDYCSAQALQEASVRKQCDAMAELLVHGQALMDVAAGERLGEKLNWPGEQLNPLLDELDALRKVAPGDIEQQPWSCANVEITNRLVDWMAQVGEINALHEMLNTTTK